ncbi:GDP-fucose synthetase [Parvularcula bermudensis HTCC2503]|uniref:GDP-L-fucose synthase n=1 Tax=Parvularcula bermudensis (strain ATCC BAA-594 / HTCC2503 / KCTC 12087) TaxID=314260 RepID=E0TFE0_PARBH|nr:GDP-L-fucose synthase [Parvularcula bermudensis]ADM09541.1 GDP-fucose synthetase [Parvularcula bermudensis HTCC2503]
MTDQQTLYSLSGKRVWVAGHRGMVGSALLRRLEIEAPAALLTVSRDEVDLRDQSATREWVAKERPDAVFVPAAKVGGIHANAAYPAEFLYDNVMIAANVIEAAFRVGVEKLLFLGSSCIYPKFAAQPIAEEALLTGPLEPTNEWYAIAKIAGIKLCQSFRRQYGADFISAMPSNLYGPGDNYHPENSHVLPALIRKAHSAKCAGQKGMEIWGTGTPRREFLHVDDCADGLVHLMKGYSDEALINVGSGTDIPISDLALLVMDVVGVEGDLSHDLSKPDGTPRKLMDNRRIRELGWTPAITLREGIAHAYADFLARYA